MNDVDVQEVKRVKVANVVLRAKLMTFTKYFFLQQYKRKYANWEHLEQIADVLERVLSGEIKRLIINIAPRYGKTEIAVKAFIAYCLALNPQAKFIHTTYSSSLALDNSEQAKDLVLSDEYQKIFPHVKLKTNSKSKQKWSTEDGGGVYATSSGGQITGFGAGLVDPDEVSDDELADIVTELVEGLGITCSWLGNKAKFGGAIIIDDPNKPDDADSELLRNRVNERYDSTISNRVNSRDTPIIIIQQRTHEDDLSGYLIRKQGIVEEGGDWHVLKLSSIKSDGTALCPQKDTIEELLKKRAHNEAVFDRQHMQDPTPKAGLLFPESDLMFEDFDKISDILDDPDNNYCAADPANEGGDDFAASDAPLIGKKIYIRNVIYNTKGTDHNELAFAKMVLSTRPSEVGFEGILGWAEAARRVKEYLEEHDYPGDFRVLRPRTNKHARIVSKASFIRNHFVFRKDWQDYPEYAKFMRNVISYLKIQEPGRKNKHDDGPDLCEMIASYYEKNFPELFALGK